MTLQNFRAFGKSGDWKSMVRQQIAEGAVTFKTPAVNVTLKEKDLPRVHDIIGAVDSRRVFYNEMEDEEPCKCVESIRELRIEIRDIAKGLWACDWTRKVIQIIQHNLEDFLTTVEKGPLPASIGEPTFEEFEVAIEKMRINVWTLVARLFHVYGNQVKPLHLPTKLESFVKEQFSTD